MKVFAIRLNTSKMFGDGDNCILQVRENYSKEEITAELKAAFLSAVTGIREETITSSAAYIKGWLKALKNDKKMVLTAASQAQKAADFILGTHAAS